MNKRFITLIVIIAAVVGFNIYRRIDKVKLDGRYYPKDSKGLNINANSKDFSTEKLNKFTELERLSISKVSDGILEDFGDFKELSSITFFYAKLNSSAKSSIHMRSLKMFRSLILMLTCKESISVSLKI